MGKLYKFIKIDRDLCIGAASCISVYPEIFQLDDEQKAVLLKKEGEPTSEMTDVNFLSVANVDDDQLLLAAQSCPTAAIYLFDDIGKQVYPE